MPLCASLFILVPKPLRLKLDERRHFLSPRRLKSVTSYGLNYCSESGASLRAVKGAGFERSLVHRHNLLPRAQLRIKRLRKITVNGGW